MRNETFRVWLQSTGTNILANRRCCRVSLEKEYLNRRPSPPHNQRVLRWMLHRLWRNQLPPLQRRHHHHHPRVRRNLLNGRKLQRPPTPPNRKNSNRVKASSLPSSPLPPLPKLPPPISYPHHSPSEQAFYLPPPHQALHPTPR